MKLSRYKWDIGETRFNGCGELTTSKGHTIYYNL